MFTLLTTVTFVRYLVVLCTSDEVLQSSEPQLQMLQTNAKWHEHRELHRPIWRKTHREHREIHPISVLLNLKTPSVRNKKKTLWLNQLWWITVFQNLLRLGQFVCNICLLVICVCIWYFINQLFHNFKKVNP